MNKKLLWKIEELWNEYYLSLRDQVYTNLVGVKQPHNVIPAKAGIQNEGIDVIPTKAGIQEIKKLYKNNISIYNPDFHFVSGFSFESSQKPVHNDEYGEYFGLKYSQVLEKEGKLIYLFDNHNKIIQPFLEYAEAINVGSKASYQGFDVVHIDAHDDDAFFEGGDSGSEAGMTKFELKNIQKYIQQTRISDFFDFLSQSVISTKVGIQEKKGAGVIPAKAGIQNQSKNILDSRVRGNDNDEACHCESTKQTCLSVGRSQILINKIHRYTKSTNFQEFKKPQNPYILSLDIDIFGPEGDFTDLESKIKIIAQAWQDANVVCIATSPGFIEQDYAHKIIEIFTK